METTIQTVLPNLIKKSYLYNILITDKVEEKIRGWCNQISTDEWSGILFYSHTGSFENKDLKIICEDIYVMDIGTSAFTSFDESPEIINYMAENMELLDMQMGLIHSHNKMATFFSGTDLQTLRSEGAYKNHFVSLIVNNAGIYSAAITRKVTSSWQMLDTCYKSFGDISISNAKDEKLNSEEIEYFDLKLEFETPPVDKELPIKNRIQEIRTMQSKKSCVKYNSTYLNNTYSNYTTRKWNSEPVNKSLLGTGNTAKKDYSLPFDYDSPKLLDMEDTDIPYGEIKFNADIIHSLLLQLITGSVVISNESKIDPEKWISSMPALFEKRFGKTQNALNTFESWADSYIDFLCTNTKDVALEALDFKESEIIAICAYDLIEALEDLSTTNPYIDIYKNLLMNYLI